MKAFHMVRDAEARSTKGFTLDHRRKSWDASVESDLRNAATFQHSVLAQGGAGEFGTSLDQLEAAGFRASGDVNYFGGVPDFTVNTIGGTVVLHDGALGVRSALRVRERCWAAFA